MGKLFSVQYLRAIAALLVVVAHAFSYQIGVGNRYVVLAGEFGVQLFFVISGFIMVYISGNGAFSAAQFLYRRAIRIVPLYWLFTMLTAVLAMAIPSLFKTTVVTWPHLVESLLFIVHEAPVRGGTSPLLSQGWTLNYEAYFYVVFALLAVLGAKYRISILTVAFASLWAFGLLFPSANPVIQFYVNAAPLGFALGCWAGLLAVDGRLSSQAYFTPLLVAAVIAGVFVAVMGDHTLSIFGQMLTAVGLLLLGLRFEERIGYRPILKKLGDASYAIYLSHLFIIAGVLAILKRWIDLSDPPAMMAAALLASVLAAVGGIAVHEIVEKRILDIFGRKNRRSSRELKAKVVSAE